MLIWNVRLAKAKRINFPVKASTIQMTAWHSPQKAAAGPATAASRRRARSQAEVRILCILSTECWGWGEAEDCVCKLTSPPSHPAAQVAGGHTALNTADTTMPKLPNPYSIDTTDSPTLLSVTYGGYVGWRFDILEIIINFNSFLLN